MCSSAISDMGFACLSSWLHPGAETRPRISAAVILRLPELCSCDRPSCGPVFSIPRSCSCVRRERCLGGLNQARNKNEQATARGHTLVCLAAKISAVVRRIVPHEGGCSQDRLAARRRDCSARGQTRQTSVGGALRGARRTRRGVGIVQHESGRRGGWPGDLRAQECHRQVFMMICRWRVAASGERDPG